MKTVIEMAHEAAIGHPDYDQDDVPPPEGEDLAFFERFAALIRADEREACAKVCDKQIKIFLSSQYKTGQPLSSFPERHASASCAEAIRARGDK